MPRYLKLTNKSRKALETLELQMRVAGYKPDLRWLEANFHACPLCGGFITELGTISAVLAPEAEMAYIPYFTCRQCVDTYMNRQKQEFGSDNLDKIEATIFGALGIDRSQNYMMKVPEGLRPALREMLIPFGEERVPINVGWLQNHTMECPSCGQHMDQPAKVGISVAAATRRPPVAVPYLLCPECAQFTDAQLSDRVQGRILGLLDESLRRA